MTKRSYYKQDEHTVALLMTATESWLMLSGPSEVEDLMLVFIIVLTLDVGRIDWEDDFLLFCFDSFFGSGCNTRGGGLCLVDPSPPAARSPGGRAFCGDLITMGFAELACCLICFSTWGFTNTVCFFLGDLTTIGGLIREICCCLGDLIVWGCAVADCWLVFVAVGDLKAGLMGTCLIADTGGVPWLFAGTIITSESFKTLAAGALGWSELLVVPTFTGGCCFVGVGSLTVVALGSLVSFSFSWCSSLPGFGVAMLQFRRIEELKFVYKLERVKSLIYGNKGLNFNRHTSLVPRPHPQAQFGNETFVTSDLYPVVKLGRWLPIWSFQVSTPKSLMYHVQYCI